MKQSKLSVLENKYYYGISRYFWHVLIASSILSIIGAVGVYLWSYIPPKKYEVTKPPKPVKQDYPDMKEVALKDILDALPKQSKKEQIVTNPLPDEIEETNFEEESVVEIDSLALSQFNIEMGNTKSLLPATLYGSFWQDKYNYTFNSKRDERMYKKTKNPALRKRVLVKKGFKQRFLDYTDWVGLEDYNDKTYLLKSINSLLEYLDQSNRIAFINNYALSLPVRQVGTRTIEKRFKVISPVLSKIKAINQLRVYSMLWSFIKNNPNDGLGLVANDYNFISKVAEQSRIKFIKTIHRQYGLKYNNKLEALIEVTNNFFPYIDKVNPDQQAEALAVFYKLYIENNKDRSKTIQQIENQYSKNIETWENDYRQALNNENIRYNSKLAKKRSLRDWSYKGAASAFVSILLITLILLLLSMIRNINRLSEAMYNNTKIFQEEIIRIIDKQKKEKVLPEKDKQNTD